MHYGFGGFNGLGWFGAGFGMILFWILVIAVIALLVRLISNSGGKRESRRRRTPIETLEDRYAAGDISREEFMEKKKDLVGR